MDDVSQPQQPELDAWTKNWQSWVALYQDYTATVWKNLPDKSVTPHMDWLPMLDKWQQIWQEALRDPDTLLQSQAAWWQDVCAAWSQSQHAWLDPQSTSNSPTQRQADKRFRHEAWQAHPAYQCLQQIQLLTEQHTQAWLSKTEGLDAKTRAQLQFIARQVLHALSPSNFVLSNPELWQLTLESQGANLTQGMQNMLDDLKRHRNPFSIRMTDYEAFRLGDNIARTPGYVVFENELFQLIQYKPVTPQVAETPLLILPPWINKYYILDLSEKNSYVQWLLEQGHTVFVVSWVNPDTSHSHITFQDYVTLGALTAIEQVQAFTQVPKIHCLGFCIGGTLLATALAVLAHRQQDWVASATFLATLLDFAEPGEIGVFIDEQQIAALEKEMAKTGFMDGRQLAWVFNMLRDNDLIWSYFTNNYLAGKPPMPFDLLYWNADSTNLPAPMQSYYLRNMYLDNHLIKPNYLTVADAPIDLRQIRCPAYFIATEQDHIAPWASTYSGATLLSGPTRFVLGGSGHIAGIVNPPAKNKYGFFVNNAANLPNSAAEWQKEAKPQTGSWWTDWQQWISKLSPAATVPARKIPKKFQIEAAPGRYVRRCLPHLQDAAAAFQVNEGEVT